MRTAIKAAAAAASLLMFCAACTTNSAGHTGEDYSNDSASLLAQYDGSSDVAAYSAALDRWQAKCIEDRVTDAGYVDATYRDEQKHGVAEASRLVVMRHLTASVPADTAPTNCDSVAAAYLVLVEK